MTNQISVSRALSKSKSLLEEAQSNSTNVRFGYIEVNGKTTDGKSVKESKDTVVKTYQSVNDKINESFRMRQGINKINANTMIDVGFGEISILDALSYKLYIIPSKKLLLNKLIGDRNIVVAQYRTEKATFDKELNNLESRSEREDMTALIEHNKKYEPKVYALDFEIEAIRKEVDYFESEFDAIMSELNPTLKFDV